MWILVLLALGCVAFCAYPLLDKSKVDLIYLDYVEDERMRLKQQKANLILIIKEIDFDYETGKLSKEDYVFLRDKYEAEAVSSMKKLEQAEEKWNTFLKENDSSFVAEEHEQNA